VRSLVHSDRCRYTKSNRSAIVRSRQICSVLKLKVGIGRSHLPVLIILLLARDVDEQLDHFHSRASSTT